MMPLSKFLGMLLAVCMVAWPVRGVGQEKVTPSTAPSADTPKAASAGTKAAAEADGKDAADDAADDADQDLKDVKDSKDSKDGKGKKKKKKKEKPPKLVPLTIENGILTVDGVTGKAELNYDIPDLHYLYIYTPGVGTAVISNKAFAGAVEQKNAISEHAVDVMAGEHKLEIYSDAPLFGKRKPKEIAQAMKGGALSAWVLVNPDFSLPTRYPAMGYGVTANAPYQWPGSKPMAKRTKGVVTPPPLPPGLRPVLIGEKDAQGKTATAGNVAPPPASPEVKAEGEAQPPVESAAPAQGPATAATP